MSDSARQSVIFPDLLQKPLKAVFDEPATTSDGGAFLLRAIDSGLRLTRRLADRICDDRQPGKIVHGLLDLVRQRVFGIACGYADCNDVARVGQDPMQKMLLGRDPLGEEGLATQSTLSRFENRVRIVDLYRMGMELMDVVIGRQRKRLGRRKVKLITIDMDPTEDKTHGAQQLSLFNGHYDSWCYLPMLGFLTFNDEAEQYLFAALLRPGLAPASKGAIGILRRVLPRLREDFPRARIRVRLDGGFANPALLTFLEEERVQYLIGIGRNSVLKRRIEPLMRRVRRASKKTGETETEFGETSYAASSWKKHERRVIMKAEVVQLADREPKDNARFVVTNLRHSPENVYKIYRQRGDSENRIEELKNDLEMDRTSCTSFWANQLRVLLTAAAYVLFQELRWRAARGTGERSSVGTLRLRLIKIGARVERSVRRFVLHLSDHHPWANQWRQLALACGAAPS